MVFRPGPRFARRMTTHAALRRRVDGSDAGLVAAAVAGDDGAFSALAANHRAALHAHCRRLLHSASDADDAVQETLLRAWRRRSRFAGDADSFPWWLRRIATNASIDIVRRRVRAPLLRFEPGEAHDGLTNEAEDDPAELVSARDAVADAYLVAIRVLPPRQRAVLVLRDVMRFPAADTARLLGESVAAVNSTLQRARAALDRYQRGLPVAVSPADPLEHDLVGLLIAAHERADSAAVVAMARRDARRGSAAGSARRRRAGGGRCETGEPPLEP
jgi:RNA polymerase sigma-70 factor (ECF subfamily)